MFFKRFKTKKQLRKEIEELRIAKDKYFDLYIEYKRQTIPIQTISASCISRNEEGDFEMSKQCICYELAEQLMPYVKFEHYKIADSTYPDEMKHIGTIQIIDNRKET